MLRAKWIIIFIIFLSLGNGLYKNPWIFEKSVVIDNYDQSLTGTWNDIKFFKVSLKTLIPFKKQTTIGSPHLLEYRNDGSLIKHCYGKCINQPLFGYWEIKNQYLIENYTNNDFLNPSNREYEIFHLGKKYLILNINKDSDVHPLFSGVLIYKK